ncbi:hypothetical protein KY333_05185 [Candidatus Woesearchaeota archaeon]|nr:hypothetical protein [Candidatus Woesearchaeota archaeon]
MFNITNITNAESLGAGINSINQQALGGWGFAAILFAFGLIIFAILRNGENSEIKSALFASFICSFAGLLLFLMPIAPKLVTWAQLFIFVLITVILIFLDFAGIEV